jgi:hypothetical protein
VSSYTNYIAALMSDIEPYDGPLRHYGLIVLSVMGMLLAVHLIDRIRH